MKSRAQSTIVYIQEILHGHWDFLRADPYLELGSNPRIVDKLLAELIIGLNELSANLGSTYTIENDVAAANAFFQTEASLEQAIGFFKSVQAMGYGSPENTRQAIAAVEACLLPRHLYLPVAFYSYPGYPCVS